MSDLSVTLIDVGWGDSIFMESKDSHGQSRYALIDSNDTTYLRSSQIFLKRFFERTKIQLPDDKPVFELVVLSHAHSDHGQGLKALLKSFGTKNFWYPKSLDWSSLISLIHYSNRSSNVEHHRAVDDTRPIARIGDVSIKVLWPKSDEIDRRNENNNSIVLALELGNVSFVLTGDAEEEVWEQVASQIPDNTRFFKVPHHGSRNGTIGHADSTPWLDECSSNTILGISSHVRPHKHPHQEVIDKFDGGHKKYYRTDEHYHITFHTDGNNFDVKYSHVESV